MAQEAVAAGSHPFGAVLASETGEVLLRQGNIDTVNHAESTLARQAYTKFSFERLQKCTLYSTFEPCAVRGNVQPSVAHPSLCLLLLIWRSCLLCTDRCAQQPCTGLGSAGSAMLVPKTHSGQ